MSSDQAAVTGHRFSSVVPGDVTGSAVVHELAGMDLIMKLHYLRAVYYFAPSEVVDGLAITDLKKPMFPWLNVYYPLAGRIRRAAEGGRPFIKCNDSGLRIVEASCGRTMDEWLQAEEGGESRWRSLVPDKVLGPELYFSPLVYIQFTRFKHGGMAIGYSWAHVLGDPESATNSINLWGELLSGNPQTVIAQKNEENTEEPVITPQGPAPAPVPAPAPIKQVEIAEDVWLPPTHRKMATHCFRITETELEKLHGEQVPPFETISALFWRCLARIRSRREPELATICRSGTPAKNNEILHNKFRTSTVKLDSSAASVELLGLATKILKQDMDEALVDGDNTGEQDFLLYGANLTFVDMGGIDLYGLELRGQRPVRVAYSVDGVGEEGAILVLQPPQRTDLSVMVILPEDEIPSLCRVLSSDFGIA
ncbi:protein ECERIFERUM 26-like [Zingiber officinale]|uniref:HXXXD-type acyl-transferase family protein n=1 Tax=Zingiber officinale TaxID=94328 RepID=A0A8J5KIV1_ZINOF|nr:protein ECERIFERUM 26-like [Zingiber officinale]KAG6478558.1 hypothetical protein ZIOFF_062001 [Zingiber officinale]